MKLPAFAGFLLLLPALLVGQPNDPVLDSLSRPLPPSASVRAQAKQCTEVMQHCMLKEIVRYYYWPARLDSLYHCCIAGKTNDERFEKTIEAQVDFYKGAEAWANDKIPLDTVEQFLESALKKFAVLGDSFKICWTSVLLCGLASARGDSLVFAKNYEQAKSLSDFNKTPSELAGFHLLCGRTCSWFGRYAEAAAHYYKALELTEKYGSRKTIVSNYTILRSLGSIYFDIGDFENAEQYARNAIQSAIDNKIEPQSSYYLLAKCMIERGDYAEALASIKKFEYTGVDSSNEVQVVLAFITQASCYRNLGDPSTALLLVKKATQLAPMTTDIRYRLMVLFEMAACEFALGRRDKALQHALESYEGFVRTSWKESGGKIQSAALLADIYKSKGDYRKALEYSELRNLHQRQVERQQSIRQLAFGEFTRDNAAQTARREAEVQAQLDRQRNIRYALFAGLGVLALLAFLLYNRYRFKQRSAEQLEAKNAEVEAARLRAEASEAFKSRFLANMSHEIRTPLHGIAGFADLLLDTSLSEKQRRWLSAIHNSTDRLGEVVNDILDLSKLEAGEVKLRQIPFSPARIARDVQDALALRAENKGIELGIQVAENVPEAVLGDPTRLYQILMNLVGNAVKFTEKGRVELAVRSLRPSGSLLFTVTDTGIGIPPEKLAAIFESFQQAGEDTTARFGGTGLGLTIAKELVRLHGSDIRVESAVGKGSAFSFALALPTAQASDLVEMGQANEQLFFRQKIKILLADDNALNREIAAEALHRHFENVEIAEATNGRQAVEMFDAGGAFDLVLMDVQMPGMSGTEAVRHIRQHLSAEVPIIALTASATPGEIENALQSGMNRHLIKPFKPHQLAQAIAGLLGLAATSAGGSTERPDPPTEAPADNDAFDLAFLREFTGGDDTKMRYFIRRFLEQYPHEISRLEGFLQQKDRESIYRTAHSFRPQLEFVGLKNAAALAGELERHARAERPFSDMVALLAALKDDLNRGVAPKRP